MEMNEAQKREAVGYGYIPIQTRDEMARLNPMRNGDQTITDTFGWVYVRGADGDDFVQGQTYRRVVDVGEGFHVVPLNGIIGSTMAHFEWTADAVFWNRIVNHEGQSVRGFIDRFPELKVIAVRCLKSVRFSVIKEPAVPLHYGSWMPIGVTVPVGAKGVVVRFEDGKITSQSLMSTDGNNSLQRLMLNKPPFTHILLYPDAPITKEQELCNEYLATNANITLKQAFLEGYRQAKGGQ